MFKYNCPLQFKADKAKEGDFKGYIAIFNNKDLGRDIIIPGAAKKWKTTPDGKLRMLFMHENQYPGGVAEYEQDEKGIKVWGSLNMDARGTKEYYPSVKDGSFMNMSIGFNILKGGIEFRGDDGDGGAYYISAIEVWEGSIVPFGMNEEAGLDYMKAAGNGPGMTKRQLERLLRDVGFTSKDSKTIIAAGYGDIGRDVQLAKHTDAGTASEIKDQLACLYTF